jgi:hypothetical protein
LVLDKATNLVNKKEGVAMSSDPKSLAKKTQETLKDLGYIVPLGHAYELLARLAGHKSWNVASTDPNFVPRVEQSFKTVEPVKTDSEEDGKKVFRVCLTSDAVVEKAYFIHAKDETEARKIMSQYANAQGNDVDESKLHEEVKKLFELEDYQAFKYDNWRIHDSIYSPDIEDVLEIKEY